MKIIILLLLFSLNLTSIHAQSTQAHKRDSLQQALQKEKTDTGRVLLLAELAYQLSESKPDTAMILALEALSLSRRIGFEKGEAVSLNRVGGAYSIIGKYPKAMEAFLQALKINEKLNNLDGMWRNNNNIGNIYNNQGDYQQALIYLFKAKDLGERLNHKEALSICLVNIGANYLELKKIDSATFYTLQAYHIASQINYDRQIGGASVVMGRIHAASGQPALALEYYRQSIPFSARANNFLDFCITSLGMAKLFDILKQKDSVLFYAKQSFITARQKAFTLQVRDAGRFLTAYYRKINKPDSAFFYLDLTKIANDSLFNQQKNNQMQSLVFDEKLRQQEITLAESKAQKERKHNLQYAAITLGVITFLILFFALSHSIVVNERWVRFFGILALLLVFELINLFIHPYLANATNHSPFLMLMALVCIAALLIPAHHRLAHWIKNRLVEKNKKIRLAAAKKTIAKLEGEQTN